MGEFKKTMWLEVMKQFNYKAVSTCSSCDDRRENIHTKRGGQLHNLTMRLHPGTESGHVCTHSDAQLCSTWDVFSVSATLQEEGLGNCVQLQKKR